MPFKRTALFALLLTILCLPAAAEPAALPAGWHRLRPSELADAATAPHVLDHQALIAAPPEAVFELLSQSDWRKWFVDFQSVDWTSPPPHRVGSTRTVALKSLAVQERFLAWEPGRRFSFSVESASLPLLESMMEDLQLEPVDGGRATRLRWRVYYTPSPVMEALHPIAGAFFSELFRQSLSNFKTYAEKRQRYLISTT